MPRKHKKKKKNPQKEKVVYYDDNSTIADMSNVTAPGEKPRAKNEPPKQRSTAKEKWKTYWASVKKMVLPMLIVLLVMTAVFGIIMLISEYGL